MLRLDTAIRDHGLNSTTPPEEHVVIGLYDIKV
jgi:hypothetical protein